MDPQKLVKVSISALGLKVRLTASKGPGVRINPTTKPYYCEISLPGFQIRRAQVPLITPTAAEPDPRNVAAVYYIDHATLRNLLRCKSRKLKVAIFSGNQKASCCGISEGIFLGKFKLPLDLEWMSGKSMQLHDSWICFSGRPGVEFHVNVKIENDPRFIFQFDGETASSPQIMQIQGTMRQPIFSCKFSRDRGSRLRLGFTDTPANGWLVCETRDKERKERKGWLVTIHDLSGSPVAAASIITPFVPSSGSDCVSRSNPGAWLIFRPDPNRVDSWEPWGRLEAWRERGGGLGLRFQLVAEEGGITSVGSGILVSETVINTKAGGEFSIDTVRIRPEASSSSATESPHSSGDSTSVGNISSVPGGFVMSCPVHGARRKRNKLGYIQMAERHVTCVEDAAVFMALAAAADLSMDACQPFTTRLCKELCQQSE